MVVESIDKEGKAYLVIMDSLSQENNGYKYILTAIYVLSKYACVEPKRTKSGKNLVKAFDNILKKRSSILTYNRSWCVPIIIRDIVTSGCDHLMSVLRTKVLFGKDFMVIK